MGKIHKTGYYLTKQTKLVNKLSSKSSNELDSIPIFLSSQVSFCGQLQLNETEVNKE